MQILSYLAGRTERIDLGTGVMVLPWWHPLRVAEQATMLQMLLGQSRDLILGVGRGAARREFAGFGVDMGESRQRFKESVEILRLALTESRFSYDGEIYKIPETEMRPHSRDDRIVNNMYGVWGSAESAPIVASLGLKPKIIPQKPAEQFELELETYNAARAAAGYEPTKPIYSVWMYCAESEQEAFEDSQRYLHNYTEGPINHYELGGSHFDTIKGYEHYAAAGRGNGPKFDEIRKGQGQVVVDTSVWGTPEQCFEKIRNFKQNKNTDHLILATRFGTMPPAAAAKSMKLFSEEVLPAAKRL
jgi:alkanesulfonate monooxygenase SsuD/methylene tetrahydromethanopterin reductase-like flavin-dependent oxidoreductase (luciferase family)